jgi:hypothetical protein
LRGPQTFNHTGTVVLGVVTADEGYRLSPQQQRLWSLRTSGPGGYLAQCAAVISGPLDPAALHRALVAVADRNEILRTTFRAVPAMTFPVQVIADAPRSPL